MRNRSGNRQLATARQMSHSVRMTRRFLVLSAAVALVVVFFLAAASGESAERCPPTNPDMLGPFYKPGAPEKSSVGKGYVLSGVVRSSADCHSIKGALIEFWLAGPEGEYADNYRATVHSDQDGAYRFESNFPPSYSGRPPHIHIKVSAEGFRTLVTQHYPAKGRTGGTFDLVLMPQN